MYVQVADSAMKLAPEETRPGCRRSRSSQRPE